MYKIKNALLLLCALVASIQVLWAQRYQYTVDLTNLQDDKFKVTLLAPQVSEKTVVFALPKIIPGTYAVSDYGAFTSNVIAEDSKGRRLPVKQLNTNQWEIGNAKKLYRITYEVEDIFDTDKEHKIYPMAATNIEEKNVVVHTPGIFGYVEGQNKLPIELTFEKPADFYGSSAKLPVESTATRDVFHMESLDDLYDTPIMYGVPDTTTVKVGNCEVLVSVYSPNKTITSGEIADWLNGLLQGARKYLGGKLPADRYAFLYYFKDMQIQQSFQLGMAGALEHTTSSFYYIPELPANVLKSMLVDVSSHEFFHIITPLTIASREVKEFNYDTPVLSKHLWLYEGTTEYTAHHVQVQSGINTAEQFLDKLAEKIVDSREHYNDTLSFTQLSKYAASTYADQYGNVYQKGALIGACLDIYLLHLSEGGYGLKNLTHDLGIRYGKDSFFEDDELFDEIARLSYPEAKEFLLKYTQGNTSIPYEDFFGLVGVRYQPGEAKKLVIDENASPQEEQLRTIWLTGTAPCN
ncbi:M61 family metallopeptidase [Parapedobacter koreensis]|uniref:Predicted metalloprotease, contains C-terminal PDZ domain n=1 Tax=Parapedobacter koreensis TaxID=332977 RepID=A0A1H7LUR2_9SPHI|nr:peptidase M61 [Parapedobacter koreensis]SEL02057.1 Predicted metalloprotease, contains C-terminal PDZ domain [Parapedobacter koreensis]